MHVHVLIWNVKSRLIIYTANKTNFNNDHRKQQQQHKNRQSATEQQQEYAETTPAWICTQLYLGTLSRPVCRYYKANTDNIHVPGGYGKEYFKNQNKRRFNYNNTHQTIIYLPDLHGIYILQELHGIYILAENYSKVVHHPTSGNRIMKPVIATTEYCYTPPGWDASISSSFPDSLLVPIYSWVERGTVRVKCLAQEHNTITRPELEPGPLDPEPSALITRPLSRLARCCSKGS